MLELDAKYPSEFLRILWSIFLNKIVDSCLLLYASSPKV